MSTDAHTVRMMPAQVKQSSMMKMSWSSTYRGFTRKQHRMVPLHPRFTVESAVRMKKLYPSGRDLVPTACEHDWMS